MMVVAVRMAAGEASPLVDAIVLMTPEASGRSLNVMMLVLMREPRSSTSWAKARRSSVVSTLGKPSRCQWRARVEPQCDQ